MPKKAFASGALPRTGPSPRNPPLLLAFGLKRYTELHFFAVSVSPQ